MIERIYDPAVVNAVSNHWSILPSISAGRAELDASPFIADPRNVYLAGEFGLAVFHYVNDGQYEGHFRVLPQGRGKWARGMACAAMAWMFAHPDVEELRCRIPRGNFACKALARCMCLKFEFTLTPGWINEDGDPIEADVYSMSRERWQRLNANA